MTAMHRTHSLVEPFSEARDTVWASIARCYTAFGSLLVPNREDIRSYEIAVADQAQARGRGGVMALMLGVTPGMALMNWPAGSRITAVDMSPAVIGALWPGDVPGIRKAICASWLAIPMSRNSCDVIVGDGSLNACRFPGEVRDLVHAAGDLLVDEGILVVRCYIRPQSPETVDAVFADLFGEKGMDVDCFKMRLWLAMQRSSAEGVAVREAARILEKYNLNLRVMKERLGWGAAAEPFAAWPTSDAVYSFSTLTELRDLLGERFDEVSVTYPTYELGHCCPTLVMRSRATRKARGRSA